MSTATQRRRRTYRRRHSVVNRSRRWWHRNGDSTLTSMGIGIMSATMLFVVIWALWTVDQMNQYHH